jgi:hypothetical protein
MKRKTKATLAATALVLAIAGFTVVPAQANASHRSRPCSTPT